MAMGWEARARRRGAPTPDALSAEQVKWLAELLRDALASPRLTSWELGFIEGTSDRFTRYGARMLVSDKVAANLRKIEEKIHAAG